MMTDRPPARQWFLTLLADRLAPAYTVSLHREAVVRESTAPLMLRKARLAQEAGK